jgi:hypothetical protein
VPQTRIHDRIRAYTRDNFFEFLPSIHVNTVSIAHFREPRFRGMWIHFKCALIFNLFSDLRPVRGVSADLPVLLGAVDPGQQPDDRAARGHQEAVRLPPLCHQLVPQHQGA